jgi:hypothetical protein
MAVTFDGVNLLIILDNTDLIVDVETDLYSEWKEWSLLSDNLKFPPAFRSVGGDPLTPGIDLGATFFLNNADGWRIKPAESSETYSVIGNLAPEDSSLPLTVPTDGAFTVLINGLQPVTQNVGALLIQQQEALYAGAVTIDTLGGGSAGTTFPIGTLSEPVNNLADAITIANNIGVRAFNLIGTITLTQTFMFWKFKGLAGVAEVDLNSQDVSGTVFEGVGLSGDLPPLSQRVVLLDGRVSPAGITDFKGAIANSVFDSGITLAAGSTIIANCVSNIAGNMRPVFNCQGNAVTLSVRKWSGGFELTNFSDVSSVASIDLESGTVDFDSTCSNGSMVLRGVGTLINDSTGTFTLTKDGFVDGLDVKLIKALDAGNVTVTGSNPFVVEVLDPDDNVTPIARFDVSADGRTRTRTL